MDANASKRMEFPATIRVSSLQPKEGVTDQPSYGCIEMAHEKLPFTFVVDSPDPAFLKTLAQSILDVALIVAQNPNNAELVGTHSFEPLDEAVGAEAPSNPEPALGEGESK